MLVHWPYISCSWFRVYVSMHLKTPLLKNNEMSWNVNIHIHMCICKCMSPPRLRHAQRRTIKSGSCSSHSDGPKASNMTMAWALQGEAESWNNSSFNWAVKENHCSAPAYLSNQLANLVANHHTQSKACWVMHQMPIDRDICLILLNLVLWVLMSSSTHFKRFVKTRAERNLTPKNWFVLKVCSLHHTNASTKWVTRVKLPKAAPTCSN